MPEPTFQKFTVSGVIANFLRALEAGAAAQELDVPTNAELETAIATRLPKLVAGRTLTTDSTVALADYGTCVSLSGNLLENGVASNGNALVTLGPGLVLSDNQGEITLAAGEAAFLLSDNAGNLNIVSICRVRGCLRTADSVAPSDPLEGDEWFDTTLKRSKVFSDGAWVDQPATSALVGFVHANGSTFDSAVEASTSGTADTLVMRGSEGQASFTGTTGSALTGTYTSGSDSTDLAGVFGTTNAIGAYGTYGTHTSTAGWGAGGKSTNGLGGVRGIAGTGVGVQGESTTGTGGVFKSSSGDYHVKFGTNTGNNRSAIERIRGWFVWFYGAFIGRLKTADITGNREWTLPDASGELVLRGTIASADISDATDVATPDTVVKRDGDGSAAFTEITVDTLSLAGGALGEFYAYSPEAEKITSFNPVFMGTPANAVGGTGGTPGWKGRMAINSSGKAYICTQEDYTEANTGWVALVTSSTL